MRHDYLISQMTWSYSRLTAYESCPYQWLQKYILHVDKEPKFFSQYGLLMHSVLQKHLEGELARDELVRSFLTALPDAVTAKAPNSKIYRKYISDGLRYLAKVNLPERKTIAVEQNIEFTFAGHPFTGFIDWQSEDEDGKFYITDHKSRTLKPRSTRRKPTKTDAELDSYLRQLYIYAAGVHQTTGRYPDYLEFNCFRSGEWITEPFRPERLAEVESWAAQLIDTITRTVDWDANPEFWMCKHICDLSSECEYAE